MHRTLLTLAAATIALPALAQEKREMDAHVHDVTKAEIAVEHGVVSIDLHAPGMDIVGFEHAASTAADKDAVEAAIRQFLAPESIVTLPAAAGCRLTEVLAHLHSGGDDHEEEGHDHAKEGEAEGEHEEGEGHSEFHIRYKFACEDEDTVTGIAFPWLPVDPPSARELAVLAGVIAAAATTSMVPALRAYRPSLADGMMVRI